MGIPTNTTNGTPPAGDQANAVISGSFLTTTTGQSLTMAFWGWFNAALVFTGTGTMVLEKSFDGGTTWLTVRDGVGSTAQAASYTASVSLTFFEPEQGVLYRWNCTLHGGTGAIAYRISTTGGAARAWNPP